MLRVYDDSDLNSLEGRAACEDFLSREDPYLTLVAWPGIPDQDYKWLPDSSRAADRVGSTRQG